jgi:hypothetical protein
MAPLQERLCYDLRACMHRSRHDEQESDGVIWHGRRNKSDSSRKHMKSSSFGIQYGRWNLKLRGSAE